MTKQIKRRNFPKVPLYMQSDKVLDQIFNDGDGNGCNCDSQGGNYDDTALKERVEKLEAYDLTCITSEDIATSDEVLAMYK